MLTPADDALRQLTWELSLAYEALTVVYAMTQRLQHAQDEEAIWQALRDSLTRILPVASGHLLLSCEGQWSDWLRWGRDAPLAEPDELVQAIVSQSQGRPYLRLNAPEAMATLSALPPGHRNLLAIPVEGLQRAEAWLVLLDRHDETGPKPFTTGDQKLVQTLAQQTGFAIVSRRAAQEEVRLARLNRELEIARDIQQSLLQPEPLALPGWEVALESRPAFEVSGDYCGFEPTLNAPGAGLLLTDVMGKGVPAALFAATARAVLLALGAPQEPERLFDRLERVLVTDLCSNDSFMALTYLSLMPHQSRVRVLNAGNPPAFVRRLDGTIEVYPSTGRPLGWPGRGGPYETLELGLGDSLVLATDGLFDQVDARGEAFGEERILAVLQQCEESAADTLAALVAAVRAFQGELPALDDMTLAVLRRVP